MALFEFGTSCQDHGGILVVASWDLSRKIELRVEKGRKKGRKTDGHEGKRASREMGVKEGERKRQDLGRNGGERPFRSGIILPTPNQSHSILQQDGGNCFMHHTSKPSSLYLDGV